VSLLGTQVIAAALPLVAALTLHGGAVEVAAIATATYLPNLLLPLLTGNWLETRRRRRNMILADLSRAAALTTVPLALLVGLLSQPFPVTVAVIVGVASVVFDIASFAHVPTLVDEPDLPAANQATQGSATTAQVAGPAWLACSHRSPGRRRPSSSTPPATSPASPASPAPAAPNPNPNRRRHPTEWACSTACACSPRTSTSAR
jgi:MFS family permease